MINDGYIMDNTPAEENALKCFRQLALQETDLKIRTDDNFILRFIRAAEGDAEKMKAFYQLKRENPDWYASSPPTTYKQILDMGTDFILPDRDPSGKRVWVARTGKIDASQTTMMELSRMHDLILETILDEPETQKNGIAIIVDLKDAPWSLLRWMTPSNLKVSSKKADFLPFPKMEYHVVNISLFFHVVFKIVQPFLSTKQKEGIFLHGDDWSSLHKKIDPSILPKAYGGPEDLPSLDKLHRKIYDYTDQLLINFNIGYPTKPTKTNNFEKTINLD